jgi:hypothetical protein
MKLLIVLLLASLSASAQDPPSKFDTVKCWTVGIEWNKDSTAHLIMVKSWMVREYRFSTYAGERNIPIWSTYGVLVEFLAKNKLNTLSPLKDFKPIIQDWK